MTDKQPPPESKDIGAIMLAKLEADEAFNRGLEAGRRERNAQVVAFLRTYQDYGDVVTIAKLADLIEGQVPKA